MAIEQYGLQAEQIAMLNIKNMIVNNLIPVTNGNIIGGSCFVGLPLYYLNREKKEDKVLVIKEAKEHDKFHNEFTPGIAR